MSWPSPNDHRQEDERRRVTERERAERTLREVEQAKRARESAQRKAYEQRP